MIKNNIKKKLYGGRITHDKYNDLLLMFNKIKEILDNHKIPFFIDGGTALGAIRHRGFIPGDKDIDIGITSDYVKPIIKLKDLFLKNNLHLEFWCDYNGIEPIDCPNCKSYLEKLNNDNYIDSLDYGRNKNGFFLKLLHKDKNGVYMNCVDIFPYKKYKDTDIYKPTSYVKEQEGLDYFIKSPDKTMYIKFENMSVPICIYMPEYLKTEYGERCLIEKEDGTPI